MAEVTSGNLVVMALTVDEAQAVAASLDFVIDHGILTEHLHEDAETVRDALGL